MSTAATAAASAINALTFQLQSVFATKKITADNVCSCILDAMMIVEQSSSLSSTNKKQLIIATINSILNADTTLSAPEKQLISAFLPQTIDVLAYVGNKGYTKFKQAEAKCSCILC